jgi:mycofactocin radical SAM maturase
MTAVLEPTALIPTPPPSPGRLVDKFALGLDAPICLTWELTYACNLACVHCLSSSGRRDPRELSTAEAEAVIDELERMQVFYVNIGGGEPTVRPDFWHLVDYATEHHVGVKFSTNGVRINEEVAQRLAASDYVDVQISLDGATAEVNDHVRGEGSFDTAIRAMENLNNAGFTGFKVSVVVTRENVDQLDDFKAITDKYNAQLRLTRLRPSGRGADVWDDLHLLAPQQKQLYDWLVANGDNVLTGDSFFHLAAFGDALPGLNLCGAGRVVCLIDPVGDVYACPFAIHDEFKAGNVREEGGFKGVWQTSDLFQELRQPQDGGACKSCNFFDSCRGGCMAAKFFTGLPLDGPDPECVRGFGESALGTVEGVVPKPSLDHSHKNPLRSQQKNKKKPVALTLGVRPVTGVVSAPPARGCDEDPLAGFDPAALGVTPPSRGCDENPLTGFTPAVKKAGIETGSEAR